MSDTENSSETDTRFFIDELMERIHGKYQDCDFNTKDYYHKLISRIKFHLNSKQSMENDSLMQKIEETAEKYKNSHEEITFSHDTAIDHAIKQHKSLIMEMIRNYCENDEEDRSDYESEMTSDNDNEIDMNESMSQNGSGQRTKLDTMGYPKYNGLMRH